MLVYGVPDAGTLSRIAGVVGVRLHELKPKNRAWQFTLRPCSEQYRRLSPRGRKVHAVCWHGHEAFFRELFREVENARVVSGMAQYHGRASFEESMRNGPPVTGDGAMTVRSGGVTADFRTLCECEGGNQ